MSFDAHYVIQRPIITEETQIQTAKGNQYTFRVRPDSNKVTIKEAIEQQFPGVRVVAVNTMNYDGKERGRVGRRRGRRSNWKKAVITLRPGDTIDLL
jgi:large subunit ribosomal protein L23